MWTERHVTVSSMANASKVICRGEGLKWGMDMDKEIKIFIDTPNSGTIHLNNPVSV